ncbi:retrovirus-related pol polyprotein from transposon TNT 1-94 [Tanacetum coccineum]
MSGTIPPIPPPFGANSGNTSGPNVNRIDTMPVTTDTINTITTTNVAQKDFTSWKVRFLVFFDGLEPYILKTLEDGPFVPMSSLSTTENPLSKRQNQWSNAESRQANEYKRLKSIIISCLPNDVMKSIIKCKTAKEMWNDLILAHEGPSDTRDTKIAALRLKFNAFKSLEGEKVMGTFTRLKCLLNDLDNNGVTIPQAEVNATYVNSLPRKWLSMNQTQRANNIWQDSDSDVEEDQRTSNEFIADLNAEYHERALLENQKRFYKRSRRVGSAIPDEYSSVSQCVADAKSLWEAIKSRFGGNVESKKMQKNSIEVHGAQISKDDINQKFLRSLPSSWNQIALIMRNKPDIDEIDIDDLYNNLRVYEDELKSTASGDFRVSTTGGINQVPSTLCAHDVAMLTVRVKKFIQRTGRNLDFKEKRPVSLDKSKIECYNCHRKGHFARECRSGRNQGRRSYGDNGRSNAPTTESSSQALNELAWGEKYEFQNYELKCKEIKINNLNLELEKVIRERDELKDKIAKWEESSKNLDEILNSQMSARDKTGLGYGTQLNELSSNHETNSENSFSIFYGRSSDEESTLANDRSSKADGYKAVPLPITGNFLTPRADISFAGESVVSNPKINRDSVIIEDWNSDNEEEGYEVQTVRLETQTVKTRDDKSGQTSQKQGIGFKKAFCTARPSISTARPNVSTARPVCTARPSISTTRPVYASRPIYPRMDNGNPEILLQDHTVVDSGFSSHMTGNKAYLSDYEDLMRLCGILEVIPKGGKITGKIAQEKPSENASPDKDIQDSEDVFDKEGQHQMPEDEQHLKKKRGKLHLKKKADQATNTNTLSTDRPFVSTDRPFVSTDRSNTPYVSTASTPTGDPTSAVSNKREKSKASSAQQPLVKKHSQQNRTNHKYHTELFDLHFKLQKVWVLVDFPYGKKVIGTKWVFRNKRDERKSEEIRLFLAFTSYMGFTVYQMDVKSAFIYGTVEEELLELGMRTLSSFLMENGFRRDTIDKTLFVKKKKSDIMLVQVYVDDIIFGSTKKSMCTEFEECTHKRFQMSFMGELTFFLGLQVKQQSDRIFIFSQDKYVADILKKFDFYPSNSYYSQLSLSQHHVAVLSRCKLLWASIMDTESDDGLWTKHIEIRFYFIRDIMRRTNRVYKIHTDHNAAYLITKVIRMSPVASIDSKEYTITEASIRSKLQLADATGIHNLSDAKIYAGLATLGYVTEGAAMDQGEGSAQPAEPHPTPVDPLPSTSLPPNQSPPHSPHQSPPHSPHQSPPHSPFQSPPYSPPYSSLPRVTTLEKELKETKQTLGNDVLKLVKKVKSLEKALKRKSKKEIVSASEGEELEDQGRIIQDIDDYPLVSLVRESMKEKSTDFVTPTKASGEAQEEEEISPTILEATKNCLQSCFSNVSKAK